MVACTRVLLPLAIFVTMVAFQSKPALCENPLQPSDVGPSLEKVLPELLAEQYTESNSYKFLHWAKLKGLFPSNVKLNTNGAPEMKLFRDKFSVPDLNGFVTQFVTYALLETFDLTVAKNLPPGTKSLRQLLSRHGGISSTTTESIVNAVTSAVEALEEFHDGNFPGAPVYNFWRQSNTNGTWVAQPENLVGMLETGSPMMDVLLKAAKKHGWSKIEQFLSMSEAYKQVFKIPADGDDTGVNLALGGLLARQRSDAFQAATEKWWTANSNIEGAFSAYKKYAYRPFGGKYSADDDLVDPRTYFWLRNYLLKKEAEAKAAGTEPDIALVSTWMSNVEETIHYFHKAHGNIMPGNANNFDASVGANAIFGMSSSILALHKDGKDTSFFDNEAQKLYKDTADALVWVLESNVMNHRPDLALLYYPPVNDFYWFIARHVQLLDSASALGKTSLPFTVMEEVRVALGKAMRGPGTEQILARLSRTEMPKSDLAEGLPVLGCYWDDFLGNGDKNWAGAPKPTHDDRLFTSAVGLNTLLDTWTVSVPDPQSQGSNIVMVPDVPVSVQYAIECATRYLNAEVAKDELKYENSFFSGSYKGDDSMFIYFPFNEIRMYDGSRYQCAKTFPNVTMSDGYTLIAGVKGVMHPAEYENYLFYGCFYMEVPLQFRGYNVPNPRMAMPGFPYWSSPSFTRAMLALGFTKYQNMHANHNKEHSLSRPSATRSDILI